MSTPGQAYLTSSYRPGTGTFFTNSLDPIAASFDCVPNQVTVFDPQTPSIQTTYAITGSIGGTRLRIGGAVVGVDRAYPAGSPLSFLLVPSSSGLALTTTGSSGPATLIDSTLNVPNYATGGGSGTVTSVAMTTPSWLTVGGSPVTTTGTLAVSAAPGLAGNTFLATPNGTTGTVALRAIVAADLPSTGLVLAESTKPTATTTYGATTTFDFSTNDNRKATLTGNTIVAFSNVSVDQRFSVALTQDGTGSRLVTSWPAGVTWANGAPPVLTTTAGATDLFMFWCNASNIYIGYTTAGGTVGTVTSISVVSANGLAGSVATATTTPAIMLSTTVTGILKGNGTAISAATAGTDYIVSPPGSSGQVTYNNSSAFGGAAGLKIGSAGQANLPAITVASPASFDIYVPATNQGTAVLQRTGGLAQLGGCIFSCGQCNSVNNTASATSVFGGATPTQAGQSLTIPANALKAQNILRWFMTGWWGSTASTPTITVSVLLNGTAILTSQVATTATIVQAGQPFASRHGYIKILTTGGSATAQGTGDILMTNTGGGSLQPTLIPGGASANRSVTFASNAACLFDIKVTWSAASASNFFQVDDFELFLDN